MAAILFLIVVVSTFGLLVWMLGTWMLGPIDRAAKSRNAPVKFSIADFLCLFVVIQIPLAAAHQYADDRDTRGAYIGFTVLTWILAPIIWLAATRALSKAGVDTGWHRLVFVGLVIPLSYYGLLPFAAMTLVGCVSLLLPDAGSLNGIGWYVLIWFILGASFYGCGLYTRWMVAHTAVVDDRDDLQRLDDVALGQQDK